MGGLAHNRLEALAAVASGLARFVGAASDTTFGFDGDLRRALAKAEDVHRTRRAELRLAQEALAMADDADRSGCEHRVHRASDAVHAAAGVVHTISGVVEQFSRQSLGFRSEIGDAEQAGQAALRAMEADLADYLARHGDGTGSASGGSGGAGTGGTGSEWLSSRGLTEIDVGAADYSDNPILSWNHASRADIEWAVDRWDAVVSKVAQRGGSREELAARDARAGTVGTMRQLAGVWDMFLGSDPITLSENSDGSMSVDGGRHRLEVARAMGVSRLPARVIRRGATS